jgi:group I intron endonuclease
MKAKELLPLITKIDKSKISGVYIIYNVITEKVYIGQSKNIYKRINMHKTNLYNNKHENNHLQNSWNKYKIISFIFGILEKCSIEKLKEREEYWIKSIEKSQRYNIIENCFTLTEEQIQKIRDKTKKRKGHQMSELGKIRWLEKNKGLKRSQESIKKIIEGRLKKGEFFSKESKEKISLIHKGKPKKLEAIEKMRLKKLGKKDSEETKKKKSEAFKNSKLRKDLIKIEKISQLIWWMICLINNIKFEVFIKRNPNISHRKIYKQNKLILQEYINNNKLV